MSNTKYKDVGTFCIYCQKEFPSSAKLNNHINRVHIDTYIWHEIRDAPGAKELTPMDQDVLNFLGDNQVTLEDLQVAMYDLGHSMSYVGRRLRVLIATGHIERVRRGVYWRIQQ
jgi:hypothetical protein